MRCDNRAKDIGTQISLQQKTSPHHSLSFISWPGESYQVQAMDFSSCQSGRCFISWPPLTFGACHPRSAHEPCGWQVQAALGFNAISSQSETAAWQIS